ncbi:addiction module antidote protein [Dyella sp.]|uniref:addiction module antidote protein n=1 Tax=Dyella sp. TaxID=1869338 RepID=UPI002B4AA1DB|nr:addiction module antidote protein [Dyella sp.]HKT27749.1 addiction module antidote protein [Dyella sp.]
MTDKFTKLDLAELLTSDEAIELFLSEAFETKDPGHIAYCLGVAARAKGMVQVSKETGLARGALYRMLSEDGNPTLKTMLSVLDVLGLDITVKQHAAR